MTRYSILFFLLNSFVAYPQNIDPDWSPDGKKIVFAKKTAGDYGEYRIHVMDADGSNQVQLTNVAGSSDPKWSPDGTKILFNSNMNGTGQVYVMNSDGSGKIKLTPWKVLESGAEWSPSGDRIAFMAAKDQYTQVYVFNANGSNPTQVAKVETNLSRPVWSPDGNQIVSLSIGGFKGLNYLKTDLIESKNEFILNGGDQARFYGWTKDLKIIYSRETLGLASTVIRVANADETDSKKITTRIDRLFKATISPSGEKLLCETSESILVVDVVTRRSTKIGDDFHSAVWSPDSKSVAMVSRNGSNIFTVNADGTSLKQLTFP